MRGITVAIWGNPGSGKTTLSAALANRLTASFGNVLLVGTDKYCPAYAQWYPEVLRENEKEEQPLRSLGNILSVPELTVDHLRQYTYLPKANDCIGLMGYLPNQGAEYSEDVDQATAYRFLELVREYAEVTVVDCSSQVSDELAAVAIRECDIILYLVSPTPKGMGFAHAMGVQLDFDETGGHLKKLVSSPYFPNCDHEQMEAALGVNTFVQIPYQESIFKAEREKALLKPFGGDAYGKAVGGIAALVKETFDNNN